MSIHLDPQWLNEWAAKEISETEEFAAIAQELHAGIVASAAADSDSGDFADSIKIRTIRTRANRIRDYEIYSDAPEALAIEYGHLSGNAGSEDRKLVPGKHHFSKTTRKMRKRGGR